MLGRDDVVAYECQLRPGDSLYIPLSWWHSFFGNGLSMSVTHWWTDERPRYRARPRTYLLERWRTWCTMRQVAAARRKKSD